MKNNTTNRILTGTITLLTFSLSVSLSGCKDFLTMTPRGEKVVRTAEDYRDILGSFLKLMSTPDCQQFGLLFGVDNFAIPNFNVSRMLSIYSMEMQLNDDPGSRYYDQKSNAYNSQGHDYLSWLSSNDYIWDQYYSMLGPLNLIISDIDNMIITDPNVRNMVVGEALVWRAYGYYKLMQYYSPYKDNKLGIPMFLDPTNDAGNAMPPRETQQAVFRQIISDLKTASGLLEKTATQPYNFAYRKDFINAFLADVYWYKADSGAKEESDWSNALSYAEQAMKGRKLMDSAEKLADIFDISTAKVKRIFENDEFYIRIADGFNKQKMDFLSSYYGEVTNGYIEPEFIALYTDDDLRKEVYISSEGKLRKYNLLSAPSYEGGFGVLMPFRLANAYLIYAEAAVHTGQSEKARQVLQQFIDARYKSTHPAPTSADQLLAEIQLERKKEFLAEIDATWIYMKRYQMEAKRFVSGREYSLSGDDFRYSFPIPRVEMQKNKSMIQNPGWAR